METNNQLQVISEKQLTGYLDIMGLATQLTEKEKAQFLEISISFGLNPFKREIYCSKYNGQMTIIVGYETYIKRAERSGQLDGWQVITEGKVDDNTLKAIITIHRKDRKIPFVHEVYYSEYVQKTSAGAVNKFWQKAHTMIKKVAMAQGFRLCFNDELGGMPYTKDELDNITEDVKFEEVKQELPEFFKTAEEKAQIDPAEQSIKLLEACVSLGELQVMWSTLDQKLAGVLEAKDRMKVKLTQNN